MSGVDVPTAGRDADHAHDRLDLDAIRARAEAATEGPWHVARFGHIDAGKYDTVIGRGPVDCMAYCYGGSSTLEGDNLDADRVFIAAARTDVPELVAEVERLRKVSERMQCTICDEPIMPFEDSVPDQSVETDDRWMHRDCAEAGE